MVTPDEFDYTLPRDLIAHSPLFPRDSSRLMVVNRKSFAISHHRFSDLPSLLPLHSSLVFNDTKVIPARLQAIDSKNKTHEVFLTKKHDASHWECMISPGIKKGDMLDFGESIFATVATQNEKVFEIIFNCNESDLYKYLELYGSTPIPPYISPTIGDNEIRDAYQTVYAAHPGSVAAPTAGLHFTPSLLAKLGKDHEMIHITLHVSLGTFAPLTSQNISSSKLHPEIFSITPETKMQLTKARSENHPLIAVGTTSTRTLESLAKENFNRLGGETDIFIYPPYKFKLVDGLITNFHLPKSSLLMLVAAFCSFPNSDHQFTSFKNSLIYQAYQEAIKQNYRFYSFGDAMLIL